MATNLLEVDHVTARTFLLDAESYSTLELPAYFAFQNVLNEVASALGPNPLAKSSLKKAKALTGVNHTVFDNKDGKYQWRMIQFINPLIYVSLTNLITKKANWEFVQSRIASLHGNASIKCLSIPVLPKSGRSQKDVQVSEWVETIEEESVRLAIDFDYIFHTDITDCYGSIYTHSVAWALHTKAVAKANRMDASLLGNVIDDHLQAMSNGQTNGIPQGSAIMDFIAEFVLAYADDELSRKLNGKLNTSEYRVLRYRDDYRIFVREQTSGELILKMLNEVLLELGLRLNASKTKSSDEIVLSSIKPDKLALLDKPDIKRLNPGMLRRELLSIYISGKRYPNAGSIGKRLTRLHSLVRPRDVAGKEEELLSILINIALDNPRAFPAIAALISILFQSLPISKTMLLKRMMRKINLLPNSGYFEIWLQRVTVPNKIKFAFGEKMCALVEGQQVALFDTSWIADPKIAGLIDASDYVDPVLLREIDPIIRAMEFALFAHRYPYS